MKIFTRIIVLLLSTLGFTATSCLRMYGQPPADFKLNTTVKDKQSDQAIEGIRLVVKEANCFTYDTLHTDAKGQASLQRGISNTNKTITVVAQDVDGTLNGRYKKDSTKIEIDASQFRGGNGHGYYGSLTKDIEIKLEKEVQ